MALEALSVEELLEARDSLTRRLSSDVSSVTKGDLQIRYADAADIKARIALIDSRLNVLGAASGVPVATTPISFFRVNMRRW
jgi:hypothetical protein